MNFPTFADHYGTQMTVVILVLTMLTKAYGKFEKNFETLQ